jgi:mono/diheme cytochrome c family protein
MVRGMATVGLLSLVVMGCSSRGPGGDAAPLGERVAIYATLERPRCAAPLGLDVVAAGGDASGSTVVMARVHGRLLAYIADEDEAMVRVLDVDGSASPKEAPHELGSVKVPGRPGRMVMLPGGRLAVTLTDRAEVALYTPAPLGDDGLDPLCTLATPDEPVDLAMTPDHKMLLVVSDWAHTLVGFDSETADRRFEIALPRSPRAVVASSDGAHAYVAHAAGGKMSVVDLRGGSPTAECLDLHGTEPPTLNRFDFFSGATWTVGDDDVALVKRGSQQEEGKFETSTEALAKRSACQGFALAEIAGPEPRVLAPLVEVATGDITAPSSGYGSSGGFGAEVPAVAVIDEATGKIVKDSVNVSAGPMQSCLLPRAATVSGGSLFVACMGIDTVIEYEVAPTSSLTQEFGTTPRDVERRRWPVGSGPTGIAVHGSRAVVWSQFDQTASVFTVGAEAGGASPTTVTVSRRTRTADEEQLAMGRALFHSSADPRIASDGRSCASCHPNGRDDGLVWSTPGGPRQTPMLAGRLPDTAPYGWDGAGEDLGHHLDHTLARLEGQGLPPLARASLVRYIATLPGPNEHPSTSASVLAEGHAVFLAAGCESCHASESAFADGRSHEVGSRVRADKAAAFDTPSLRFVAGTAPYFHDGRYATLRDLLTRSEGPMGAARDRSPADIDALETYVRSL